MRLSGMSEDLYFTSADGERTKKDQGQITDEELLGLIEENHRGMKSQGSDSELIAKAKWLIEKGRQK